MLVVDASVAVKFVAEEAGSDRAFDLLGGPTPLIAPEWLLAEVPNALWNKVARENLPPAVARQAIVALPAFFDRLHPTLPLLQASYELMFRLGHALYDCLYLALAVREEAVMITADKIFQKTATAAGIGDHVRLL